MEWSYLSFARTIETVMTCTNAANNTVKLMTDDS